MMPNVTRRKTLLAAGALGMAALAGRGHAHTLAPSGAGPTLRPDGWDADAPPELAFLFEARVQLHLPPMDIGQTPDGRRVIFLVSGGTFDGPHLRGRVVPNGGADWVRIRPDGTGILDVRFSLETHDNALIYVHWQGRFWSAPDDAAYALDVTKPDDPAGAWRYYFRTAPFFETGDPRYAWLNNMVAVTKSRTGDGGPIHRVFAVM